MAKLLIDNFQNQIDINLQFTINSWIGDNLSVLNYTCWKNNVDMAKFLIDNFKNTIDIYSGHYSALYWAIYPRCNVDVVKLLIDNFKDQIDINLRLYPFDTTILQYACEDDNYNFDVVKLLIDNFKDEIDINLKFITFREPWELYAKLGKYSGGTILHWVIYRNNVDAVKLIIDNFKDHIDPNKRDEDGRTIFILLVAQKNVDMAKLLIDNFKNQIDINKNDYDNDTALYLAIQNQNFDMAKLLIDHFHDSIRLISLNGYNLPVWHAYLIQFAYLKTLKSYFYRCY